MGWEHSLGKNTRKIMRFLFKQNYGNILVLTGPAGSGKSATIDVLSKDLDIELQEWNTPVSSIHAGTR